MEQWAAKNSICNFSAYATDAATHYDPCILHAASLNDLVFVFWKLCYICIASSLMTFFDETNFCLCSASISMTRVSNAISFGLPSYGLFAESRFISQSYRNFPRRSSYKYLRIRAVQGNDGRRSLVDIIRIIPELSRNYFRSRSRRTLFGGISLLGGFYVAQTISLSFGVLAVNDVIAAVVCVLLTEYVTKFYYSRPKVTFPIALLNNFKMGFTYGLFIDAFKLAS